MLYGHVKMYMEYCLIAWIILKLTYSRHESVNTKHIIQSKSEALLERKACFDLGIFKDKVSKT